MSVGPFRFHLSFIAILGAITAVATGCSNTAAPPPPAISVSLSPSTSQTVDQGGKVTITATVTNGSSSGAVTWSVSGPGTLSATTGASVIYGALGTFAAGGQQVTVTATSVQDTSKTASVAITVYPDPLITASQVLPNGSVGTAYNQSIAFTGGATPFQWSINNGTAGSIIGGSLPAGLTLDSSTGAISGTPTEPGTWYFEATVTDATGVSTSDGLLSIEITTGAKAGNPVPFLNQTLTPTAVQPGSAGLTLKASGVGFVSGATIDWNGTALATTLIDSEHLSAAVPAADVATAGTASITVVNPTPGGGRSNFVYFPVGPLETTVSFANAAGSPISVAEPFDLVTADFNEDGKPDLAIGSNDTVDVLLGKGDGTFTTASGSPLEPPLPPFLQSAAPNTDPLVVGDFTRSGHAGLAVGLLQNGAVAFFAGQGDGTFANPATLANTANNGALLNWLIAADFNQGGNLSLAVGSSGGTSPELLEGYGDGYFTDLVSNISTGANSATAGDFSGDGKLDLAVGGPDILLGNGDGTFAQGASGEDSGFYVMTADFNGDGKLDLAASNAIPGTGGNTISIYLGDGSGGFTLAPGSPIAVGSGPVAIVAADFNNDGKLDLAIANGGENTVSLLLGNGDGTFTEAAGSPFTVGNAPYALAAADFNGDGKLDLAVMNATDGTISILLQQ